MRQFERAGSTVSRGTKPFPLRVLFYRKRGCRLEIPGPVCGLGYVILDLALGFGLCLSVGS